MSDSCWLPKFNDSIKIERKSLESMDLLDEVLVVIFIISAAKVWAPGVSDGELVESQHIHHTTRDSYKHSVSTKVIMVF